MTITSTDGLVVEYPGGGSDTSLHYDDRLSKNETDTARFYVNTEGASPGEYTLETATTYLVDGDERVVEGSVVVNVTG